MKYKAIQLGKWIGLSARILVSLSSLFVLAPCRGLLYEPKVPAKIASKYMAH